jgi:hypothetical protein
LFHLEDRCPKLMSSLKASWPPYLDFSNMFNQCWAFQLKWPTHQHPYLGNYIPNCRPWYKHMTLHQSPIWTLRIHTLCHLDGICSCKILRKILNLHSPNSSATIIHLHNALIISSRSTKRNPPIFHFA